MSPRPTRNEGAGPTISLRSYLSSHQIWAAEHFARLAAEREPDSHGFDLQYRAYVTGAILHSVGFLEAMISELLQDAADNHPSYIETLEAEAIAQWGKVWRKLGRQASVLKKYRRARATADATRPHRPGAHDPSACKALLRDTRLLIRIRNLIVHYRPETISVADEETRIEREARDKFAINPNMATNPWWPDQCLSAGCATWSARTARAFADAFGARVGVKPNYQRVVWKQTP